VHPHPDPASALILITLAVTFCYAGLCAVQPFGTCHKCRPADRKPHGRRGYCRRCHGTRLRLRIGRRLWNFVHRLYTEGTR
jgi:Zn finger protein HypA/HybF involved in hydrogenase expression